VVERFFPLCVVSPYLPFGFIAPKGVIPTTLRTTDLKFLMTKRLREIIKIWLPINIYNNYRL